MYIEQKSFPCYFSATISRNSWNLIVLNLTFNVSLPDNQPIVEKAKFQSVDNNYIESATNNRYKISGTQRYLAIRDQRVMTSVLTDIDNTDASK
jgi:hypothetical protein